MSRRSLRGRAKVSTTVSPETYDFLTGKVTSGEAASLAEAIDTLVDRVRRLENRKRLAEATANYFAGLTPDALGEEDALAHDLSQAAGGIDFDREL